MSQQAGYFSEVFVIRAGSHDRGLDGLNFYVEVDNKIDLLPIVGGLREYGYSEVTFEYVNRKLYSL